MGTATRIGRFPVGIDPTAFQRLARQSIRSPLFKELVAGLGGRALVIGVDRLDYSKGLIQRLDAFDTFLAGNPDWLGQVTYLQLPRKTVRKFPSHRTGADDERRRRPHQRQIWRGILDAIRYVNRVYSRSVLAGLYRAARVGLVTPLRDGMNLVPRNMSPHKTRTIPAC